MSVIKPSFMGSPFTKLVIPTISFFQVRSRVHNISQVHLSLRRVGLWGDPVGNVQLRLPTLGRTDRFDTLGHFVTCEFSLTNQRRYSQFYSRSLAKVMVAF